MSSVNEPNDPTAAGADEASPGRAIAFGVLGGGIVALILVVAAALLAFTAGLIVIAYFMGRVVGSVIKAAAGSTLPSTVRESAAILISVGWIAVSWIAVWLVSLREGGILPLGDYLAQTFGPLVPLEFMIATLAAWWSAR